MTTEDVEKLKLLRSELKAIMTDVRVTSLRKAISELERKCDHTYPDGSVAWEHGCRDATCSICGEYEMY